MKIDLVDVGLHENLIKESTAYKGLHLARISTQHKNLYRVITNDGEISAEVSGKFIYSVNDNSNYPVVGDWVMVDRVNDSTGNAIIHHVLTRKSVIERKAPGMKNDVQILASNIDIVFICMSLNNDFNLRRIERYLSIVWESQATPIILLTKSDLCNDVEVKLFETQMVAPGVDVIITSSIENGGLESVQKYISKDKTIAFVGSSGVGKSTIINRLIGKDELETNDIRKDDKGRHTTTYRQLFILPQGGVVIDNPGMRELQIAGADIDKAFSDIETLAEGCRFRDCKHDTEPGCKVLEAIENGIISAERLENYKKLQREFKYSTLNSRQVEKQKINEIFGSMGEMKQAMDFIKKYKRK